MRNPCEKAENKFVIVELCETIQPRSIEFANYELFSSGPRSIRLWSAERFPGGEWRQLTELTAMDSRQIQQFPIPVSGVYAKFIKVELLSHYGNEHYCTLSVLKVLGISMVDEYEAEAEAASVAHVRNNLGSTTEVQQNITTTESPETSTASPQSEMNVEAKANDISTVTVAPSASKDEIPGSNPTVIDLVDEVSGHLISKFVDVMKDKFGRGKDNSSRTMKECSIYSPFSACYFCPKDGSYIYPRQFCQAFVWKAPISISLSRNEKRPPAAFTARRGMSSLNRLRRSRFAFLQRKSPKYLQSAAPDIVPQQANPSQETTKIPESTNGKESVFMKLNKRIAALELNMSLSSEYLSELSRQYVAQTDEHQKHMKQAKKVVDEAVEAIYARVNETLAHKIAVLRKEVDMLSGWLSSMRMTASKMTVSRFTRGRERPVHEKCVPQPTQLHRYSPPDDGLWTTEQVVYMVITTQLVTVLLLAVLNFCYQRFMTEQPLSDDQRSQIEELVNERVMDAIRKNSSLSQYYDNGNPTWVQRGPPVEDSCSLHTDGCSCFAAECSSSSQVTNSDDSSTEEMHSTDGCSLLSPEVHAIASVA
ncbi:Sad1 / UNC-like protein [Ancylostoma caninum]|uniref:Sad1 / UNC-like protein n=1 Tax=Ancylostoma caninum TaxID=29170 RepID=A0A368G3F8_ANCCA|nr:Sad1 / UNC-like protein [Ancylostoma caninum]